MIDNLKSFVFSILLLIDGLIYDLVSGMFSIFEFLVGTNLFSNELYSDIVKRIYIILGMVMMFVLAYSLLKAVINPDDFSKGESSFPNLIKNVVTSLAIIAILPTVFTVAFNIQNSILNYNVIPKLILGDKFTETDSTLESGGRKLSTSVFYAFFHINEEVACSVEAGESLTETAQEECAKTIDSNAGNPHFYNLWLGDETAPTFADIKASVDKGDISMANFDMFSEAVRDGKISYTFIISTLCGLFLLYVLVNFCFDMAVRLVKLMFFQIIAPIPVVCRVIPGGKMKDVFSTWLKKTISTFIDSFLRIFIIFIGVFIINNIVDNWTSITEGSGLNFAQRSLVQGLVLMGVVVFIRQAPKLLGDIFHLDIGDMKLGLMDKLAMGGGLAAAAALGGAGGMMLRNGAMGIHNFRQAKGFGNKVKAAFGGIGSTAAGTISGGARGLRGGVRAKNYRDVMDITGKSIAGATIARNRRAAYKYEHQNDGGVLMAHAADASGAISGWLGFGNDLTYLKEQDKLYSSIKNLDDQMDGKASDLLNRASFANNNKLTSKVLGSNYDQSYAVMKSRVSSLGDYSESMNGQSFKLLDGTESVISNDIDYAKYKVDMQNQLDNAERALKKYIKTQSYNGNFKSFENDLGIEMKPGSGELLKANSIYEAGRQLDDLYRENPSFAAVVNANSTEPINSVLTYENADVVISAAEDAKVRVATEYAKLQREQEQKDQNRKNNTKFVNSMFPPFGPGGRGPGGPNGPGGPGGPGPRP